MSLMLAPIHYMMWDKILFLDELVNDLLEFTKDRHINTDDIDDLGIIESGDLENIIDHSNIHGFLQERVRIVEEKFSATVNLLIKKGVSFNTLEKYMYEYGEDMSEPVEVDNAHFTLLNFFLDGMPCDRSVMVENTEDKSTMTINLDVHAPFWNDVSDYWKLREAFYRGFLEEAELDLEVIENKWIISQ